MAKYATTVSDATAQLQQQIEAKRSDIQGQIDQLTLTPDALLAQQRAQEMAATVALDASLGPLLQHLYDLQDAATAAAAAQQAAADAQQAATAAAQQAAQLQATNDNLMIRLAQTEGDTATATLLTRQQELASATDESTKAILRQIYAAEDQAAANNAAAAAQQQAAQDAAAAQQAAAQLAATNENLMIRLAQPQGDTATATRLSREQELAAATDESTKAILRQIYAAEDLKAAQDAVSAAQDAAAKAAQAHADAVTAAVQKATDAQTELQRAYDAQVQLLQGVISKNRDLVASLKSYESGLSASSGGAAGLQQQAQAARAQFLSLANAAIGGDSTAAGQLTGASDAYLKLAQQIAATPLAYSRAVAEVRSYIDRVKSEAEKTADVAQEQLDTLNKQVDGLVTINSSLLTIDQQIANGFAALTAALDAYRAASQSALGVMGVSGGTAPNGYTFDVAGDTALDASGVWYQKLPDGSVIRHDIGTASALFGNVPTGAAFDAMMAQAAQNIAAAQAQSKHILGIPGFAAGGWFSGGLRLVGENGPEIEATGAARYWDAAQTSAMLGGAANDDLAAEVADLKQRLGDALDRIEKHVAATAKSVDDQNKMGVWARGQQPGEAVYTQAA
jgi:chemotaxis protein histidine kinase CheA